MIVAPDTVLRWQRRRVRELWTKLSGRPPGGCPPVNAAIQALVTRNVSRACTQTGVCSQLFLLVALSAPSSQRSGTASLAKLSGEQNSGAKNARKVAVVAPTGFEPVFQP